VQNAPGVAPPYDSAMDAAPHAAALHAAVGVAVVDITPTGPVMLGGFGQRTTPSTGVHDPLSAKALAFVTADTRVVLVTCDLLHVPAALHEAVTEELAARGGPSRDEWCLCASHTHSGPVPYEPSSSAPGVAAYAEFLVGALVTVVLDALADVRPARVRSGVGRLDGLWNRRLGAAPDAAGTVDARVPVLAVEDAADGTLRAVLFGAGCHPVTRGWDRNEVSADYPGVAQREIEAALGVRALFVNTTEGDVVPATNPRADSLDARGYCGGDDADTEALGRRLADAVVTVVGAASSRPLSRLAVRRLEIPVAPSYAGLDDHALDELRRSSDAVLRRYLGDDVEERVGLGALWSAASAVVVARNLDETSMRELMIAVCHRLVHAGVVRRADRSAAVTVPVQVVALDELDVVALPGEALTGVGAAWSARVGSDTAFVVGLTNAHLRYLPLAADFADPDAATRYETVTAALAPDGVDVLLERAATALEELVGAR
jgi:hypothetical protein